MMSLFKTNKEKEKKEENSHSPNNKVATRQYSGIDVNKVVN